MHTVPGGVCTGWNRGGSTFGGCLHFLVGTGAASPVDRMWQELGALALAMSMAQRCAELGGVIRHGARAQRIIVRDGKADGRIVIQELCAQDEKELITTVPVSVPASTRSGQQGAGPARLPAA